MLLPRFLAQRLPHSNTKRLVMITGARQTGKTTLARATYPHLRYLSLDEVETRQMLRDLPTRSWTGAVGSAILDEAQKEPGLFEKVKFAFDQQAVTFSVLLGSSQILLLKHIRESLAGRVFVYELWPLLLREMTAAGAPAESALTPPLLDRLLTGAGDADHILADEPAALLGEDAHHLATRLAHALTWGGMPELFSLSEAERRDWLRSYTNTYVERDLSDIARLDDLEPFRRFTRLAALRSGHVLSYADLARDAGVSPGTARNYLHYLALSYQAFTLMPYLRNSSSRVVKAPKLYWVDPGLWRQQTGMWGEPNGALLETFVVGEIWKWVKTMDRQVELGYYRTHDGLEVDLILATPAGLWGLEIKTARQTASRDTRPLRRLAEMFGADWRGGLVVCLCEQLTRLDRNLWAVPVGRLLG
ncbi:MAG: ATP-binding protein [Anaerolineales bacterium]|nr:ATP-binding protein [Anaerolineales bacterium]